MKSYATLVKLALNVSIVADVKTNATNRADSNRLYSRRNDRRANSIDPVYYRGDQGY